MIGPDVTDPATAETRAEPVTQRRASVAAKGLRVVRLSWLTVASLAVSAVIWELAARALDIPLLFPGALDTFGAFIGGIADGTLVEAVLVTLGRLARGFAIGVAVGAPLGLLMGYLPPVRWFFEPYVNVFRFVTPIALLSIIITWVGSGDASIIALVVYITMFIVLLNVMVGVMRIPAVTLRAARSLGAGPIRIFFLVIVPAAFHSLITGMRIALGYAFMTVVAAEIIAGNTGLGYLIWTARLYVDTATLFAGLLMLGVVGLLVDRLFVFAVRHAASRYVEGTAA